MITTTSSKPVVILPRFDMAGQKVRHSPAPERAERVQVEMLHSAGIGRERARALAEGLSRLAWTA